VEINRKNMNASKILTGLIVIGVVVAGIVYFKNQKFTLNNDNGSLTDNYGTSENTPNMNEQTQTPAETETEPAPATAVATMTTNMGTFQITLDGTSAPKTVANFIKLAKDGFYNNLTFHRIVQDFVIQGGDPAGDGTGGPGYTVPAEIKLKHTIGAIAMARTGDAVNPTKASSGSQFYIALQPLTMLDGQYTVFGYVTSGLDVVSKIGATPTEPNPATGEQSTPLQPVIIKSVTIEEK
jgi:cyclophilin family peptidyl-prolyl cis-trans isomerase